ncbi:hypothetical protein GF325_01580 [Candidatus Bathyarchaeota archaeon]|nr:hypothetical protein [Candidatus Bathyarchaeota archaeon]
MRMVPGCLMYERRRLWHRIAWAIERNDFWMKRLSFSQTKGDVELLYMLHDKYNDLVDADGTTDGKLKRIAGDLETNDGKT